MKQIWITKANAPLTVKEQEDPGLYPDAPPFPAVVGYEVSGVVDATGPDAKEWQGKAVVTMTKFGGYSDTVLVNKAFLFEKPAYLSFVMIYVQGGLRKNQTLLIHNAGGGVGLAAIDIARHLGAKTIGTASARKHEDLKARGCDHCIDYRTENVSEQVLKITNGKGVDLIMDPMGDNWTGNYNLLKKTGRLGVFGASSLTGFSNFLPVKAFQFVNFIIQMPKWSPLQLMNDNRGVFGTNMGHMFDMVDELSEHMNTILAGADKNGWVRPAVDNVFTFEQVNEAHQYIEDRKNYGKVMLVPTQALLDEYKASKQ
ncbi:alcohol dehydrogenase zinc-binding domain protein [Gorgonomyces haynaldii]|nr:alcohol dehydrogenase zinc-binding domain protein [Gorgonomyces haynaldii]